MTGETGSLAGTLRPSSGAMRDFPPEISVFYSARRGEAGCRAGHAHPGGVAPVVPEDAVAPDPADDRGRGAVAAPAHARPVACSARPSTTGIVPGSSPRDPDWAGLLLLVTLIGAFVRHRHAHPDRAQLADRALRDHEDGDPQGRADGPRPAASYADRRGAERRLRRLRRVRRAHRDRLRAPAPSWSPTWWSPFIVLSTSLAARRCWCWSPRRCWSALALPLLRPLHRRQQIERARNSDLTSMATDIVAGLRILRGIGGERTFGRNYDRQSQLARQAGVVGRHLAGRRSRPSACCSPASSWCCWSGSARARCIAGELHDRPADQLPGLRAVHDLPDPDLLRARPEGHPGDGLGPQGGRRSSSSSRRGPTAPRPRGRCPQHGDLVRRADRLRGPRRRS